MALDLSFSITERNDNKLITLTDNTGTYHAVDNADGWGDPNPAAGFAWADIVVSTDVTGPSQFHLILDLTITTSDNTSTTYDTINLRDHNGSDFTAASDLVFEFDCSDFEEIGIVLGTSSDEFPDGIYSFDYRIVDNDDHTLTNGVTTTSGYYEVVETLIEGRVRNAVYELLRDLTTVYNCKDCCTDTVMDAIFARAYLDAIYSSAYVSKTEELLNQLAVLQRMVTDGTDYTW